jgi:hypothetical protein
LAEKVVVEDVVEMADYTKGDLCQNDMKMEWGINEDIFDSFGLEINKNEL